MSAKYRVAVALRLDQPYPNHQDVFTGVCRYAREHPHWVCVVDEHPGYLARRRADALDDYDGVIARANPPMQHRLLKRGIPLVNTLYSYAKPSVPGIYLDVRRCGQTAAEHLLERGFRRFAFFDVGIFRQARDIGRHFAGTLAERGYDCHMELLPAGLYEDHHCWRFMRQRITCMLQEMTPPAGFLVSVPWTARLLSSMCEQSGWHVPQQLAILCVDDQKNITELPTQISCIDCNYEEIGYQAAAMLDRMMSGQTTAAEQLLVLPRGIITRESTDYFAVEDEVVAEALRYIAKRLDRKLTVDQIARQVAVSPRSLQRRFDRAMGRGISEEIRRLRVELAKRLLGEQEMPIHHVARMAGFNSSIILGQVFHRELDMSPSAYRKHILTRDSNRS